MMYLTKNKCWLFKKKKNKRSWFSHTYGNPREKCNLKKWKFFWGGKVKINYTGIFSPEITAKYLKRQQFKWELVNWNIYSAYFVKTKVEHWTRATKKMYPATVSIYSSYKWTGINTISYALSLANRIFDMNFILLCSKNYLEKHCPA